MVPRDPVTDAGRDRVALALAMWLGFAVSCITVAVLWDAISSEESGLSDNATQVLLTTFSGVVGVLGGYLGYQAGVNAERRRIREGGAADQTAEVGRPAAPGTSDLTPDDRPG